MNEKVLELELEIASANFTANDRISATVVLTNAGSKPVAVVSRLSPGYPDSFDRELFFEITTAGKPYTGFNDFRIDYNRPEVTDKDVELLQPGRSVEATVNLQEWYRMVTPGSYEIRAVYQPDPHARLDSTAVAASGPVTITVE